MIRFASTLPLFACFLAACDRTGGEAAALPADPHSVFDHIEDTLLAAQTAAVEFSVTAEGAFTATLNGRLVLGRDHRLVLESRGEFAGQVVDARIVSDGTTMALWTNGDRVDFDTPAALREAIVVGFTRMGILHNLARLAGGAPPDHGEGRAAQWVVVSDVAHERSMTAAPDSSTAITFNLTVDGEPSGTATLVVDERTGLPRRRLQTVEFPQGDMRVTEAYTAISIDSPVPPGTFDIPR